MDFSAFFPRPAASETPPAALSRARDALARAWPEASLSTEVVEGAHLFWAVPPDGRPTFRRREAGLLAVKGIVLEPGGDAAGPDPDRVLEAFSSGEPARFARFEGSFGLAAWDGRARRACLAVDQAATINLYAVETQEGLYVTTTPVALAAGLRLPLDPEGVRQFLIRGYVMAPLSMFRGLRRLDFGEHGLFENGRLIIRRHWLPFAETRRVSFRQAASELAAIASDRVGRYVSQAGPAIFDLTSGYDSRLVVAAAHHAGRPVALTVNGDRDSSEITVALQAGRELGWEVRHFVQREIWNRPIDEPLLREMLHRTGGEMVATAPYHHQITRPILSRDFRLHLHGASVGSDLARYYSWSHEFLHIGRRRPPNIDRLLRYRFLQGGAPPAGLFARDPFPAFDEELRAHILRLFRLGEGRRNTEVLDLVHLWKNTAFISAYTSTLYGLLPTLPPINSGGFIRSAMGVPLRFKLTAGLVRQVIWDLSPELARLPTHYGTTAEPPRLRALHRELRGVARRVGHLAWKLDRVYLKDRVTRLLPFIKDPERLTRPLALPLDREALGALFEPSAMASRGLYRGAGIERLGEGPGDDPLFQRALTLELLCREVGTEPGPELLAG